MKCKHSAVTSYVNMLLLLILAGYELSHAYTIVSFTDCFNSIYASSFACIMHDRSDRLNESKVYVTLSNVDFL